MEKTAIFNKKDINNKEDVKNFLNLLRKSETDIASYNKLMKMIDLSEWAKFAAYQILTDNYHNDSTHNMRIIFDPWSGLLRPIIYDPIILILIILFFNISIVHARSRAPAWACLFATKITRRKFVTTFHGTYNFKNSIKKFYNSIMVRSDLIIAGSNFIFSHINKNYFEYLGKKKKFLVIFRGINIDYFDPSTTTESDEDKLFKKWELTVGKK